jgi:hypothetical protein
VGKTECQSNELRVKSLLMTPSNNPLHLLMAPLADVVTRPWAAAVF